ncbi:hypothetical protein ACS3SW_12300 [Roseobacteraceae bacterium S113]
MKTSPHLQDRHLHNAAQATDAREPGLLRLLREVSESTLFTPYNPGK